MFVPLGGYSGPETALDYIAQYFGSLGDTWERIYVLVAQSLLLDALNEMPRTGYAERVKRIQKLLDDYRGASVVVTCRALDYVEALNLEKLEVKPLDPLRQFEFLRRYLVDEGKAERLDREMAGAAVARLWSVWQQAGCSLAEFWTLNELPKNVSRMTTWGSSRAVGLVARWLFASPDGAWRQLFLAPYDCSSLCAGPVRIVAKSRRPIGCLHQ